MAVQPDGKIVVGGRTYAGDGFIARLDPDGNLDPTFTGKGVLVDRRLEDITALAVQPDGKIVVAAGSSLIRFTVDGSVDAGFGDGGVVQGGAGSWVPAVASLADGRLAVGWNHPAKRFVDEVVGLLYSPDGRAAEPLGSLAGGASMADMAPLDNGSFVMLGYQDEHDGAVLARFVPGAHDHDDSFAAGRGVATIDFEDYFDWPRAVTGRSGLIYAVSGVGGGAAISRFNADGIPSADFGTRGSVRLKADSGFYLNGNDLVVQDDGGIVVGAEEGQIGKGAEPCPSCWSPQVLRLTPTGQLDQGFGVAGVASLTDVKGKALRARGEDVALLPGGRILIAGYASGVGVIVGCFGPDGKVDRSFGSGGIATVAPSALSMRFRARLLHRRRATLNLHVRAKMPWSTIDAVGLKLPRTVSFSGAGWRRSAKAFAGDRKVEVVTRRRGRDLIVHAEGSRSIALRLPADALWHTGNGPPWNLLRFGVTVRFGGNEGTLSYPLAPG